MKAGNNLFVFFTPFIFSVLFFSCKSDSPVTSSQTQHNTYSWNHQSIPYDVVSDIILVDNDNFFFISNGVKKYSGGTITPINVDDSTFYTASFNAYSSDYYIFGGISNRSPDSTLIKIYDNGIYKNYYLPKQTKISTTQIHYIISKDKFFVKLYPESNKYFLFQNGIFTEFELNEGNTPKEFFKANNNIYIKAVNAPIHGTSYYKVTEAGPVYLWTEPEYIHIFSELFYTTNDLIKITADTVTQKFSYFTEQGWNPFLTYNLFDNDEHIFGLTGESRYKFVAFKINLHYGSSNAYVWDGIELTPQTNFPTGLTQFPYKGNFTISNYRDNHFYFYPNYNSRTLYKAVVTQ